jgi:PRTRC genetic system protein B
MFNTTPELFESNTSDIPHFKAESIFALVFHSINHQTVVTKHNIDNEILGSGTVVDPIDIIQATIKVNNNHNNNQAVNADIISERVLLDDHEKIIWHSKASSRTMWFATRSAGSATLRPWWPNLLFVVNKKKSSMSVFALATGARPTENTRLYQAPLMNISKNGITCLGSATLPKNKSSNNIVEMENCIYDSNFSHLNDYQDNKQEHMKSDKTHIEFYRNRQETKQKFKANEMTFLCQLNKIL